MYSRRIVDGWRLMALVRPLFVPGHEALFSLYAQLIRPEHCAAFDEVRARAHTRPHTRATRRARARALAHARARARARGCAWLGGRAGASRGVTLTRRHPRARAAHPRRVSSRVRPPPGPDDVLIPFSVCARRALGLLGRGMNDLCCALLVFFMFFI